MKGVKGDWRAESGDEGSEKRQRSRRDQRSGSKKVGWRGDRRDWGLGRWKLNDEEIEENGYLGSEEVGETGDREAKMSDEGE